MAIAHHGQVVSINNSIMLVLVDADEAPKWHGTSNATGEDGPWGSDWDKVFKAMHPDAEEDEEPDEDDDDDDDEGETFVKVKGAETEVVALSIQIGGMVDVFSVEDRLVLVEGSYDEEERDGAAFQKYVAAPPSKKADKVGKLSL
jgi:hypothetical protein